MHVYTVLHSSCETFPLHVKKRSRQHCNITHRSADGPGLTHVRDWFKKLGITMCEELYFRRHFFHVCFLPDLFIENPCIEFQCWLSFHFVPLIVPQCISQARWMCVRRETELCFPQNALLCDVTIIFVTGRFSVRARTGRRVPLSEYNYFLTFTLRQDFLAVDSFVSCLTWMVTEFFPPLLRKDMNRLSFQTTFWMF
jgi:hypothetical protein